MFNKLVCSPSEVNLLQREEKKKTPTPKPRPEQTACLSPAPATLIMPWKNVHMAEVPEHFRQDIACSWMQPLLPLQ